MTTKDSTSSELTTFENGELTPFDEDYDKSKFEFYQIEDEETGRRYYIPDLSGNVDLFRAIHECQPKSRIPPELKIASAALWCVLGSSVKVSKLINLPAITIRQWYKEPWWHMAVRETRKAKNEEFDAKLTGLLDEAIGEIGDRLAKGETIVTKEGELRRVPVSTRNLATLLGILYDKRALSRGDPTSKVVKVDVNEHLEKVAGRLERLVGKIPEPTVVDGEFEDVT